MKQGPASPQIVEQLVCDASLRRVLTCGPSLILDIGEATPIIPTALRRAIQLRDRHCQFAGCTAPWIWCDIHHLVPLHAGGVTTQANLVLLCHHHSMIHQAGWRFHRCPHTSQVTTRPPRHAGPDYGGLDEVDDGADRWALDTDGSWVRAHPPPRQPVVA